MGGLLSCVHHADGDAKPAPRGRGRRKEQLSAAALSAAAEALGVGRSERWGKGKSGRKDVLTDEQALAAAALILEQSATAAAAGGPFDRSSSLRFPGQKKQQGLPRSASSRLRSLADPVVRPQQLLDQDINIDALETNYFVLVHGGGFGAWCWYKTIALLESIGFKVVAINLTASGISTFDANKVTGLPEYVRPLTSFLETLGDGEKVILVGHDLGGACISYAMEKFPSKIAKAVYLCAAMINDGENILDMFSKESGGSDLMQQAQTFLYANGKDHPPTAIDLDRSLLKDLLFNQSSSKDVSLALLSLRPIPFAPLLEKLSLSDKNYGSVRRFYIETTEDNAIHLPLQQIMCSASPPEKVYRLKSDHSPFFSKPQALQKILVEISKLSSLETDCAPLT